MLKKSRSFNNLKMLLNRDFSVSLRQVRSMKAVGNRGKTMVHSSFLKTHFAQLFKIENGYKINFLSFHQDKLLLRFYERKSALQANILQQLSMFSEKMKKQQKEIQLGNPCRKSLKQHQDFIIILVMGQNFQDYVIDQDYILGQSAIRGTTVLQGTHQDESKCAFRYYTDASKPRPPYRQWQTTSVFQLENTIQKMDFYHENFDSLTKQGRIQFQKKIEIMLLSSKQLLKHHEKGQVHGNIHSKNILFDENLKSAHYFDSLLGGNLNTLYSSPENQFSRGFDDPVVDVWALGILFIQLLSGWPLCQGEKDTILDIKPYELLLFPQEGWLKARLKDIKHDEIKRLIFEMLNRNFGQRIDMNGVKQVLQKIAKKESIYQQFWQKLHQKTQILTLRFSLIEQSKESSLNSEIDTYANNLKIKTEWLQKQKAFDKNNFRFYYDVAKNELIIAYFHPNRNLVLLEATYGENDLPSQTRERFSLKYLALLLYHTHSKRFSFSINGQLKVELSESAIKCMIFDCSN